MPVDQAELVWHDDGHVVVLSLNRADLQVLEVRCPDENGPCSNAKVGCLVRWFITRFGLDCHVGVAPPAAEMQFAWAVSGDVYDLDACQVWIVSTEDDLFAAWAFSQRHPQ